MKIDRITEVTHHLLQPHLHPGMRAIDATVGNGQDSCFLARHLGSEGHLLGFDIQETALAETRQRLNEQAPRARVDLQFSCHSKMAEHAAAHSIDLIVFNLGYLPGADHQLTTTIETTLKALDASLELLKPKGLLSIVVYPGHPEGEREASGIKDWLSGLVGKQTVASYRLQDRPTAPYLLQLQKKPE